MSGPGEPSLVTSYQSLVPHLTVSVVLLRTWREQFGASHATNAAVVRRRCLEQASRRNVHQSESPR